MNCIMSLALGALLVGSFAVAADEENKVEVTKEASQKTVNGSGTDTTTVKKSHKVKHGGTSHKAEKVETTKKHSDGSVEHSTEESNK